MLQILSNPGRQKSLRVTISLAVSFPAKVLNSFVSASVFVTTPFVKADILIKNLAQNKSKIT